MKSHNEHKIRHLIEIVNNKIQGVDLIAQVDEDRAYGGIIRAAKGKLTEWLCKELLILAWDELDGKEKDLDFSQKRIPIPLKKEYIKTIKSSEVRNLIISNYSGFVFHAQVDLHVMIRNKFILGVECKSYTENAMLKRILVDYTLLKSKFPNLKCALIQLESQLTGDYSKIDKDIIYGSYSTHTLLSYFDVDLHIMTLLKGERKVQEPIHKPEFFKPLEYKPVEKVVIKLKELLEEYI